jgi:hypothetical protein
MLVSCAFVCRGWRRRGKWRGDRGAALGIQSANQQLSTIHRTNEEAPLDPAFADKVAVYVAQSTLAVVMDAVQKTARKWHYRCVHTR